MMILQLLKPSSTLTNLCAQRPSPHMMAWDITSHVFTWWSSILCWKFQRHDLIKSGKLRDQTTLRTKFRLVEMTWEPHVFSLGLFRVTMSPCTPPVLYVELPPSFQPCMHRINILKPRPRCSKTGMLEQKLRRIGKFEAWGATLQSRKILGSKLYINGRIFGIYLRYGFIYIYDMDSNVLIISYFLQTYIYIYHTCIYICIYHACIYICIYIYTHTWLHMTKTYPTGEVELMHVGLSKILALHNLPW